MLYSIYDAKQPVTRWSYDRIMGYFNSAVATGDYKITIYYMGDVHTALTGEDFQAMFHESSHFYLPELEYKLEISSGCEKRLKAELHTRMVDETVNILCCDSKEADRKEAVMLVVGRYLSGQAYAEALWAVDGDVVVKELTKKL